PMATKRRRKMAFRFEGLEIFHLAIDFAAKAYQKARKFPSEERFDLIAQTRRAANSIVLNIAEGSGRGTKRDFSHFLDVALGSTFETVTCFFLAKKARIHFRSGPGRNKKRGGVPLQEDQLLQEYPWRIAYGLWPVAYGKNHMLW